jgi:tRNA-2-methylthio-N6-dimethylallyladenosine synthase
MPVQESKPKLYIKTYGCQMNVYDSDKMANLMLQDGFELSEKVEGSDLVILNTCHIREKASEKIYSELGKIKKQKNALKKQGRQMIVAVAGCVAQAEGAEIIKRENCVDIVVGPQAYQRLPAMVSRALKNEKQVELDFSVSEKFDILPQELEKQTLAKGSVTAFLTIQEGCDKFCSFCVVPYTRGAEYSRNPNEIYKEAVNLVNAGAVEISLLGQNVNAYKSSLIVDGKSQQFALSKLIDLVGQIKELKRIRYSTSHPNDMSDDLILAHKENEKLMPLLHLPVQSGSDAILKKMNRKHTRQYYLDVIESLKKARPDIAFSSDFIVGFPGETDSDFEDTLNLVERVGFAQSYSFKYSPRPGTPASEEDDIEDSVKDLRLQILQKLIRKQQTAFNTSCLNKTMPVLFEKKGKHAGQVIGKTPYGQSIVVVAKEDIIGSILQTKVSDVLANSLGGVLV